MKRTKLNTFIKHYTISLWRYWYNEWKLWRADEITLVYTMAKVGSTGIYLSLKQSIDHPVFHIHNLDVDQYKRQYKELRSKSLYPDSRSNAASIVKKIKSGKQINVITLVREPIARNISAFFEVLEFYTHGEDDALGVERLKEIYVEKLPHTLPLIWFDDELKSKLGIDPYSQPFDHDQKFVRMDKDNIRLLILRTDTLDTIKIEQLNSLCSSNVVRILRANIGSQKYYSSVYSTFQSQIRFDKQYVDEMYTHKYMQHFYRPREIDKLTSKWQETG